MTDPANLVVRSASVDIGSESFAAVRFTIQGGEARVLDSRGTVLASGEVVGFDSPSRRLWHVEMSDGAIWTVRQKGCNCGKR
jgi:hypothetical protein